jgi:signal transduction histidine kinase
VSSEPVRLDDAQGFMGPTSALDFQRLFESAPGLYLILATDLTIVAVSNAYLAATMTQREAIIGRGLFEVFPDNPDDPSADGVSNLHASLNTVLSTRKSHVMAVQKYDIRRTDGTFEVRHWSPLNKPVLSDAGEVLWIIHRVEDVTAFVLMQQEQRRNEQVTEGLRRQVRAMEMEIYKRSLEIQAANVDLERRVQQRTEELELHRRKLEQQNQDLEQFAYMASHDLQEPLRMVTSYVQLLQMQYGGKLDEEADEFIQFAVDGTVRMKQLISDVLIYSSQGGRVELSDVDLNEVLEQVLLNLRTSIAEASAQVLYARLPSLQASRTEMVQLMQNLISNAIKFRRDGVQPLVQVTAHEQGPQWRFEVRDNGIGIQEQHQDKVFVPFKRLNDRSRYPGSGIGLAVVQKIVLRYGGRIGFTSTVGEGTAFQFTLGKQHFRSDGSPRAVR